MNLLQMSFSGAVFILAVVIIRAMTINRLPKKTLLFLWDIVLFRLLVPFSIPSTFSVYSLLHWGFWTPEGSRMQTKNPVFFLPQEPSGGTNPIVQTTENTLPSISVWFIIWCIGIICCGIFFLTVYLRNRECHFSLKLKTVLSKKLQSSLCHNQNFKLKFPNFLSFSPQHYCAIINHQNKRTWKVRYLL